MNLPLGLIKFAGAYLRGRTFQVKFNGTLSTKRDVDSGSPQGGIVSALFYLLYTRDIPQPAGILRTNFADDTSAMLTTNSPLDDKHILQNAVDGLISYFQEWKIQISAQKTQLINILGYCVDTSK